MRAEGAKCSADVGDTWGPTQAGVTPAQQPQSHGGQHSQKIPVETAQGLG